MFVFFHLLLGQLDTYLMWFYLQSQCKLQKITETEVRDACEGLYHVP